jgi:hypothetical protein
VQVAHFLEAPTQPWVAAFWTAAQSGRPEVADNAGLVSAARPAIASLLCGGHPAVLDPQQTLMSKLRNTSSVVHAAAARSSVQQAPASPQLALDFGDGPVAPADDSASAALAQRALAAVQALPQRPALTLRLRGATATGLDCALAEAE